MPQWKGIRSWTKIRRQSQSQSPHYRSYGTTSLQPTKNTKNLRNCLHACVKATVDAQDIVLLSHCSIILVQVTSYLCIFCCLTLVCIW